MGTRSRSSLACEFMSLVVVGGVGLLIDYKQEFEGREEGLIPFKWVLRRHFSGWGREEV